MAIPGLPALADDIFIDVVQLVTADILAFPGTGNAPQWGLFLDGEIAVTADNVMAFDFKQDFRVSNFPVEEGSFESYNKVPVPFDVRLTFSSGGSIANRQALIQSVDAIIGSTETFDAVTPEKTFQSINPVHQSVRRSSAKGAGLVVIDVYFVEIRVTATQQFTTSSQQGAGTTNDGSSTGSSTTGSVSPNQRVNGFADINQPQSPSAAPQVSDGNVQPVTPSAAQSSAFGGTAVFGGT